jgi:hypothetical protein
MHDALRLLAFLVAITIFGYTGGSLAAVPQPPGALEPAPACELNCPPGVPCRDKCECTPYPHCHYGC